MATVRLERITKAYANGFEAVHTTDLVVDDSEMMVLVGPSGCGKTTLLRIIAGLEQPSSGDLWIGDQIVTHQTPKQRNVAMVFQDYALYPHMTVGRNIGFALKQRRVPKAERDQRVREVAKILGLAESIDRKPGQLSGGQRQRVAMGRAIVREPTVFLMDEPLSNLDAQLRVQMRAEVLRIQQRLGATTLYVTHDQVEAMTMGDRVAVMRAGSVQQLDTPDNIYEKPANVFVAAFIGSPAMNLYEGLIAADGLGITVGDQYIPVPDRATVAHQALRNHAGQLVVIGIRPEDLTIDDGNGASVLAGAVNLVEALGNEILIHFSLDAKRVRPEGSSVDSDDPLVERGSGIARLKPQRRPAPGERLRFAVDVNRLYFFDPAAGTAIS